MKAIGAVDVIYQPPQGACGAPETSLAEMDEAGVAVAFISQCNQWTCERQWMCVDTRMEDVARFAHSSVRFAGLAGYNPFDVAESMREMEAGRALGFRGVYLHLPSFGLRFHDPRLYPMFAKASELEWPAVLQVEIAEPNMPRCIERVCRDFPELALAIVHPRPSAEMFELCGRFERLAYVLDTPALSWMALHHRALLERPATSERCMWGSNAAPLAAAMQCATALELSADTLETVLRTSALRFFSPADTRRRPQALATEIATAER